MTGFAIDFVPRMFGNGVISSEVNGAVAYQVSENPGEQGSGKCPRGPGSMGEDAMIGGRGARSETAHGPQEVGNGPSRASQNGGQKQQGKPQEGGPGESKGENVQESEHGRWQEGEMVLQATPSATSLAFSASSQFAFFTLGQTAIIL